MVDQFREFFFCVNRPIFPKKTKETVYHIIKIEEENDYHLLSLSGNLNEMACVPEITSKYKKKKGAQSH